MAGPPGRLTVLVCVLLLAGCAHGSSGRPAPDRAALTGVMVFVRHDPAGDPRGQIYRQRADGAGARAVAPSATDDESPALSADGRQVAFTRRAAAEKDQIWVAGADGTGLHRLSPSGCPDVCGDAVDGPAWSPDGRSLAFTRSVFHGADPVPVRVEVWVADVASASAHRVTSGSSARVGGRLRSQDGYAGWSPDGARLLYVHEEHATPAGLSQYSVMTVAPDGTGTRAVTPNDVNGGQPVWSPDGSLIAFQSPPDDEGVTRSLYVIRPDGSGMTSLTNTLDTNDSSYPTWSPDSQLVAFAHVPQGSSGGPDLYVVGRDGSDPHPIAVTAAAESAPCWAG